MNIFFRQKMEGMKENEFFRIQSKAGVSSIEGDTMGPSSALGHTVLTVCPRSNDPLYILKRTTVCPGSSDSPEKILNIFASENEVYRVGSLLPGHTVYKMSQDFLDTQY